MSNLISRAGQHAATGSVWNSVVPHFLASDLDSGADRKAILAWDILTSEQLLNTLAAQGKAVEICKRATSVVRPLVPFIDSVIVAPAVSSNPSLAVVLWGSLRRLIEIASNSATTLERVLNVMENSTSGVPVITSINYAEVDARQLEEFTAQFFGALLSLYASTLNFLHRNPWPNWSSRAKSVFERDHDKSIKRLVGYRRQIEVEMNSLALLQSRKSSSAAAVERLPCRVVIPPFNATIVPRDDIIREIELCLDPGPQRSSLKAFTLYGLGGVGKSQLALRYVQQKHNMYDAIFWISAETSQKLAQGFTKIAQELNLRYFKSEEKNDEVLIREAKRWLSETSATWLLVFDNVVDLESLKEYWPVGDSGSVLLTSQDTRLLRITSSCGHKVAFLSLNESINFLQTKLSRKMGDPERDYIREIAKLSSGLPLALQHMASFIQANNLPLKRFLRLWRRDSARIHTVTDLNWQYNHTLATVWQFAFSKLAGRTKFFLELFGFLDPDNIPESLFFDENDEDDMDLSTERQTIFQDEIEYLRVSEAVLRTSLVDKDDTQRNYRIHRLVQQAAYNRASEESHVKCFEAVLRVLWRTFPALVETRPRMVDEWEKCHMYLPHVLFLKERYDQLGRVVQEYRGFMAELLSNCGWYMYQRGLFGKAMELLETARSIVPDTESPLAANIAYALGGIYFESNQVEKAKDLAMAALSIRKKVLNETDPKLGQSLYVVGNCLLVLGDALNEAEQYFLRALGVIKSSPEENKPFLAISYCYLAICLFRSGKVGDAIQYMERSLTLLEASCGVKHDRYSEVLYVLANMRLQQRNYDTALDLHWKSLGIRRKVLGVHDKTGYSMHMIGCILQKKGDYDGAIDILYQALNIFNPGFDSIPKQARTSFRLASVMEEAGRKEEAAALRDKAAAMRKSILSSQNSEETMAVYDGLVNPYYSGLILLEPGLL